MAESLPSELARLLAASDDLEREHAWTVFINTFSPLILHAARSASSGYDEGMEAYTAALEGLRANDLKKLRGYSVDPRSRFSTWLVVVVRRICIDRQRERYGRSEKTKDNGDDSRIDDRAARWRLVNLAVASIDLESLPDSTGTSPDVDVRRNELRRILDEALNELEPRDRLLLTLRLVDDLPAKKIAVIQGWPDDMAVYRRIKRVTALLREKLLARGVDSSRA